MNHAMRFCYDLTIRSKVHPEARNLVKSGLDDILSNLNDLLGTLSLDQSITQNEDVAFNGSNIRSLDSIEEQTVVNDELVRNPLYVKSRGVHNVRLSSH